MGALITALPIEVSLPRMNTYEDQDNSFRDSFMKRYLKGQCYLDSGCEVHLCFVSGPFTVSSGEAIMISYGERSYPLTRKGMVRLNSPPKQPVLLDEVWYWPKIQGIFISGQIVFILNFLTYQLSQRLFICQMPTSQALNSENEDWVHYQTETDSSGNLWINFDHAEKAQNPLHPMDQLSEQLLASMPQTRHTMMVGARDSKSSGKSA